MNAVTINASSITKLDTQLDFILLDGSGSMQSKWWPMLEAIDTFVEGLKQSRVNTRILVHVFDDSDLQLVARDTTIDKWVPTHQAPIGAHFGGTPLYDAIVLMGQTIRNLNPAKGCSILIVTDGEAGYNRFADVTQARAVLDWLRDHGYQVTFMGCDFNNDKQAAALGANESNSIGVQQKLLTDAAKVFAEKRTRHARTGEDISFTEGERQQFGGLLGYTSNKDK